MDICSIYSAHIPDLQVQERFIDVIGQNRSYVFGKKALQNAMGIRAYGSQRQNSRRNEQTYLHLNVTPHTTFLAILKEEEAPLFFCFDNLDSPNHEL